MLILLQTINNMLIILNKRKIYDQKNKAFISELMLAQSPNEADLSFQEVSPFSEGDSSHGQIESMKS